MKMSEELDSEDVFLATSNASFNTSYLDYNITIPDYCPVLTKRVKYIIILRFDWGIQKILI